MIFKILLVVLLGVGSYIDIKSHKIPHIIMILMALNGVAYVASTKDMVDIKNIILRFIVAIVIFFVVCRFVKLGIGDAKVLSILTLYLNVHQYLICLLITFVIASIVSIYNIVLRKKPMNYAVPLVPFIFFSYILQITY